MTVDHQSCTDNTTNPNLEVYNDSETINSGSQLNSAESQKPLGTFAKPTHSLSLRTDTAFRQQRLPAWRPILTPQNVIPILFAIGVFFIPLGILFLVSSAGVPSYFVSFLVDS